METFRDIQGIRFIDSYQLWNSIKGGMLQDRGRELMNNGGVKFYDNDRFFVKQPAVAITGVGGIPIVWNDDTPENRIELAVLPGVGLEVDSLRKALLDMAGFGGFFTYLNPYDRSSQELQQTMAEKLNFSTAHAIYLNLVILGVSTAVENEFNSQRDLVHFTRLTEARTQSQSDPSVVVLYPEYLRLYKEVLSQTRNNLIASPSSLSLKKADILEARNLLFPAAKATIFGLNSSLRNLQKMVLGVQDKGKEEEYRRVLAMINDNLVSLFPNMFKESSEMGFTYPAHFIKNNHD